MSEVKNVLFIINKFSGKGYQPELEGRMLNACEKFDIECSIEFTSHRGHATELAREGVAKNFNRIIAVGGDGTVNEVARGLLHTNVPMGIIPKGSGNGLARHLGISMKLDQGLDQILQGEVIRMDTFKMNDHLSLNVSGIGFEGHVANLFSVGQRRGFWGYSKVVLKEFLSYREFDATLKLGDHAASAQKSFMIAIANSSQYGNNARVAPIASVMDQSLQLAIIKKVPAQRGFHFGYQMFTGKLKTGVDYECLSFQKATIQVPSPTAYHIDGEPLGHATSFQIELLPHSLHMVIPAASRGKI